MSKKIPDKRLLELKKRLVLLPPQNPERVKMIQSFADLYAVSVGSVYRALREKHIPKTLRRADAGITRVGEVIVNAKKTSLRIPVSLS